MPVTVEKNAFEGQAGMYDVLKARNLWPLTAKHYEIAKEDRSETRQTQDAEGPRS